jgi:Fe-S cluster assembly iron-binding protein IscA
MPEVWNADNIIVDVEEKSIVNDKLTQIETIEAAELKDELKKGKLRTGKKKKLQNRLRAFIALEIEHGEDEEEGGEEDKEDEDEELDYVETRIIVDSRSAHLLKFSDMKESRSTLSSDKNINVQS